MEEPTLDQEIAETRKEYEAAEVAFELMLSTGRRDSGGAYNLTCSTRRSWLGLEDKRREILRLKNVLPPQLYYYGTK